MPVTVRAAEVMFAALASEKIVLFPAVCSGGLEFRRICDPGMLRRGAFSIPEPVAACPVHSPGEADFIVIPGVAFDMCGRRIGYGKGYYDSWLRYFQLKKRIGLAFDIQVFETIDQRKVSRVSGIEAEC